MKNPIVVVMIALIAVILAFVFLGWMIMVLWNFAAVGVFAAPIIGFWEGLALLMLTAIFGSAFCGYRVVRND